MIPTARRLSARFGGLRIPLNSLVVIAFVLSTSCTKIGDVGQRDTARPSATSGMSGGAGARSGPSGPGESGRSGEIPGAGGSSGLASPKSNTASKTTYDEKFDQVQRAWGRGLLAPDANLWSAEVIPEPEGARSRVKGNRVQVRFWRLGSTAGSGEKFYDDGGIELGVGCNPGAVAEFGSNSRSLTVRGFKASTTAFYRGQPPSPGTGEVGDQQHDLRFVNWSDADGCVWGAMLGSRRYSADQIVSILDGLLEVR